MRWVAPEIIHHEDIMKDDHGSWDDFRKLVNRNCGSYLKKRGALGMREQMDQDAALNIARRGLAEQHQREVDAFFERLEQERKGERS